MARFSTRIFGTNWKIEPEEWPEESWALRREAPPHIGLILQFLESKQLSHTRNNRTVWQWRYYVE